MTRALQKCQGCGRQEKTKKVFTDRRRIRRHENHTQIGISEQNRDVSRTTVKSRIKSHRTGVTFLVLIVVLRSRKQLTLGKLDDKQGRGDTLCYFCTFAIKSKIISTQKVTHICMCVYIHVHVIYIQDGVKVDEQLFTGKIIQ